MLCNAEKNESAFRNTGLPESILKNNPSVLGVLATMCVNLNLKVLLRDWTKGHTAHDAWYYM